MATVRQKQALGVAAAVVGVGALAYWLTPDDVLHRRALAGERRFARLIQSQMRLSGMKISYLDGGHINAPTLILLHGFGASKETWVRVARHLTPFYRVLIPDLPGFGQSSKPTSYDYSIHNQAKWLARFTERLGIYPGFHLAGHSMGGYIAAMHAQMYPKQVASLWLMCPLGVQRAVQSEMFARLEAGESSPLIAFDVREYDNVVDFTFHKRTWIPAPVKRTFARSAVDNVYLHRDIFNTIHTFKDRRPYFELPLEDIIAKLDKPTLVTWGDQDRVLDVSGALTLKEANLGITVDLLSGIGHMPLLETPKRVAQLFEDWQRSV